MFSSVDSIPCFEFTFRAVIGGNAFIDDPMDVDPPEFSLSVLLGNRRYARVASSRELSPLSLSLGNI